MRILAVSNDFPTLQRPFSGVFIEQQIQGLKQIGLNVAVLSVDRARRGMQVYLDVGRLTRAAILEFKPDIVHVMYGGVMADRVTRVVKDRPTVVTFHGSDLLGEHLTGRVRQLIAGYGVWASWRAARRASGIIAVSKALRDALPADVDRAKIRIIPCGIDLERFKPLNRDACRQELGWDSDRFHVVFPTNGGDPVKRFDLAQAAVHRFSHLGIKTELHQLRGIANTLVPVWLNASDVLLLTSLHEGSPTVVKEALACNVPVISVDVGDVRERISGIAGCYLAFPNPNDLAAKLSLVHSGTRRVSGRVKMQELSLERVALQLRSVYDELV